MGDMSLGEKIGRLLGGFVFFCVAAYFAGTSEGYGPLLAVPPGVICGFFVYPFVAAPIAGIFTSLYCPGGKGKLKKDYSKALAHVNAREYELAVKELQCVIAEDPGLLDAKLLLMGVYYDHLDRSDRALELALEELRQPQWKPEHERIAGVAVDVYLGDNDIASARHVLDQAIPRADSAAARRLSERLSALS